ncbi:MAG: class I SAM-dependent methyltransferase [Pseudomonadota bacterium]
MKNNKLDTKQDMSNLIKDYSLHSGERQPGRSLEEIRKDHTFRYELAADLIKSEINGVLCNALDLFCGNGYGSYLLANAIHSLHVTGIDGSREAIDVANECYSLQNNFFSYKLYPFHLPVDSFKYVTCFESLEHVEDDNSLLHELFGSLKLGGLLIISVPNQDKHPLEKNPHHFHYRHYCHDDFLDLIPSNLTLESWYGQNVYEFTSNGLNTQRLLPVEQMKLQKGIAGQVNIYVLRKWK